MTQISESFQIDKPMEAKPKIEKMMSGVITSNDVGGLHIQDDILLNSCKNLIDFKVVQNSMLPFHS